MLIVEVIFVDLVTVVLELPGTYLIMLLAGFRVVFDLSSSGHVLCISSDAVPQALNAPGGLLTSQRCHQRNQIARGLCHGERAETRAPCLCTCSITVDETFASMRRFRCSQRSNDQPLLLLRYHACWLPVPWWHTGDATSTIQQQGLSANDRSPRYVRACVIPAYNSPPQRRQPSLGVALGGRTDKRYWGSSQPPDYVLGWNRFDGGEQAKGRCMQLCRRSACTQRLGSWYGAVRPCDEVAAIANPSQTISRMNSGWHLVPSIWRGS
jgi:hypothetical protein